MHCNALLWCHVVASGHPFFVCVCGITCRIDSSGVCLCFKRRNNTEIEEKTGEVSDQGVQYWRPKSWQRFPFFFMFMCLRDIKIKRRRPQAQMFGFILSDSLLPCGFPQTLTHLDSSLFPALGLITGDVKALPLRWMSPHVKCTCVSVDQSSHLLRRNYYSKRGRKLNKRFSVICLRFSALLCLSHTHTCIMLSFKLWWCK